MKALALHHLSFTPLVVAAASFAKANVVMAFVKYHYHHHPSSITRRRIGMTPARMSTRSLHRNMNVAFQYCSDEDATAKQMISADDISPERQQFVAKTVESFKLADLYWLESCVMAYCQDRGVDDQDYGTEDDRTAISTHEKKLVERLAFHRPTASYLLGYTKEIHHTDDMFCSTKSDPILPFRLNRFQYVADVIATGQTPQELLKNIQRTSHLYANGEWILDYDAFEPLQNQLQPKKSFSSTMLMCAVSRVLPGTPSLVSNAAKSGESNVTVYMIVESAERLYLVQKLVRNVDSSNSTLQSTHAIAKQFRSSWSRRPFQYSGAINLDVAFTIVDMLQDLVVQNDSGNSQTIRLLDPTCGSGTFLALACMAWRNQSVIEAVGIDSNPKCAHGTVRNLNHIFDIGNDEIMDDCDSWTLNLGSDAKAAIYARDSTQLKSFMSREFNCAIANLPWNRNTFEFRGTEGIGCTNSGILEATAAVLKPGSPFVIVSAGIHTIQSEKVEIEKSFNVKDCLESLGFHVLGEATVPPKGFQLPSSRKKKSDSSRKNKQVQRNSDCLITVAISPRR